MRSAEVSDYLEKLLKDQTSVDGHVSTADHAHIHRHLGELYMAGLPQTSVGSGTNNDIVLRNPQGSGLVIEIIIYASDASVGAREDTYKEFPFPAGGTDRTAFSFNTMFDDGINGDIKTGQSIIDVGAATRLPQSQLLGDAKKASSGEASFGISIDYLLDEGEIWGARLIPGADGRVLQDLIIAEYEKGQAIADRL